MDYRTCIQNSLDYIENHLQSDLTVEALAKIAGFSPYHYYRVFSAYVGLPVMEYVRRRRLAYAASELGSSRRIIDIALDYGFDTHNGFAKAFRKVYGCSPEKYRVYVAGPTPARVDLHRLVLYNLTGGIVVEPKIVTKPATRVAGYELKTTCYEGKNFREIPAFWASIMPEKLNTLHQKVHAVHHNELGICYPPDTTTGDFCYVVALEVHDYEDLPPEMFRGEIPEATYAVFAIPPVEDSGTQFSDAIQGTWKYIYESWFPNSGYEFAPGKVDYELYYSGTRAEIYIPVVKKG
jgi:AraC family transcriptional regulator